MWGSECTDEILEDYTTGMCDPETGSECFTSYATAMTEANITCREDDTGDADTLEGEAECVLFEYANSVF